MDKYQFRRAVRFFESRQEIAEFLGVTRVMVHHWWHGTRGVTEDKAERLLEYERKCEEDRG